MKLKKKHYNATISMNNHDKESMLIDMENTILTHKQLSHINGKH